MKNFFFPWKRIAQLETELAAQAAVIEGLHRELDIHAGHRLAAKKTIDALRTAISWGHFRDPRTGRLGRKGQLFTPKDKLK
tara:strand:- start:828 stop:1070 length:243 start_codon:yes stop_codon:yes gene_type:complete